MSLVYTDIDDDYLATLHGELTPLKRSLRATEDLWEDMVENYFNLFTSEMEQSGNLTWSEVTNQEVFKKSAAYYILWKMCEQIKAGIYLSRERVYELGYHSEMALVTPKVNDYEQRGNIEIVYLHR